ncbi:MAG: hypothetical protein ACE5HA_08750 [Anaerolineae bacterium]
MASFNSSTYAGQTGTPRLATLGSEMQVLSASYEIGGTESTTDTINFLDIPAGWTVVGGGIWSDDCASAGTMSMNLGVSGSASVLLAAHNLASAGADAFLSGTFTPSATAATTVIGTLTMAGVTLITGASIRVFCICVRIQD